MRTVGTLSEIVTAAKNYYNNTSDDGCPHNPVVRRRECDKKWMLESGLCDASDSDLEISLDDFQSYFYEMFSSDTIELSIDDENCFVKMLQENE